MKLHELNLLRRLVLPVFARLNPGDVTIRHHFTGDRIRIHSYRHKGYWYHGPRREAETMRRFRELTPRGATVLDVGGHVGYVALYLARLAGPRGHVYVFEPGRNNLPYLKHNVRESANVTVVAKAAGRRTERRMLYLEGISGQNNSLVPDFGVFRTNRARAFAPKAEPQGEVVEVVALDDFCRGRSIRPAVIKVDVEGFELEVLQGASSIIRDALPLLMVEIQTGHRQILQFARQRGYLLFTPSGRPVRCREDLAAEHINTFWLHAEAHRQELERFRRAAA